MKNKIVLFIILSFSLISCRNMGTINKLREHSFAKILKEGSDLGSGYFNHQYLFIKSNNNVIGVTTLFEIKRLYNRYLRDELVNTEFEVFAKGIMENRVKIDCNDLEYCFELSQRITEEYNSLGFKQFKKRYTKLKLSSGGVILKSSNLSKEELYTVLYYFDLNTYSSYIDDNMGEYVISNILNVEVPKVENTELELIEVEK